MLAGDRFAFILGVLAFLISAGILAKRVDDRFNVWSWWGLLSGIAAARLGHVLINFKTFSDEPWRIIAFWQGGFYWPAGALALICCLVILKTSRQRFWSLLPVGLALIVWNTIWQLAGDIQRIAVPDHTFETFTGEPYSLAGMRGTPHIVNLWASWCPPCRREMPMMADLARTSEGVSFIFANQGEGRSAVERYLAAEKFSLNPVLLDQFHQLSRDYGVPGLPATLFIGADGILQHVHLGEISRETLQTNIDRLAGT